jgi:hypothetical protein
MKKRLPSTLAYLALFVLSLLIPLAHHFIINSEFESFRSVDKLSDGSYQAMVLPMEFLILRSLGVLVWLVPVVDIGFLIISFWNKELTRFTGICLLAIFQCAFTTFYALCSTASLLMAWITLMQFHK